MKPKPPGPYDKTIERHFATAPHKGCGCGACFRGAMTKHTALLVVKDMVDTIHGEWCSGDLKTCKECAKNKEALKLLREVT